MNTITTSENCPKVSVITPLYKSEPFICETLRSVFSQTYQNIEVILVNDGSPDNSERVLEEYLTDARVSYLKQRNLGVAAARNTGIRNSSGAFIAFLDHDDLWLPGKLATQIRYFQTHPEVALAHGNVRFIDQYGRELRERDGRWNADAAVAHGRCFHQLFAGNRIAMATVCIRRECMDAIGPFREDIPGVDDYEYWLRAARLYGFAHIDEPLALYRLHDDNESRVNWLPQLVRTLQAVDGILALYPEARNELPSSLINQRTFELARDIGEEFCRRNQHDQARPFLMRALQLKPWVLRTHWSLAIGLLPSALRTRVRWYKSKLAAAWASRLKNTASS